MAVIPDQLSARLRTDVHDVRPSPPRVVLVGKRLAGVGVALSTWYDLSKPAGPAQIVMDDGAWP